MVEEARRPLGLYRYRLTTVDALAFERLPGEWTGWQKAAFVLQLAAIGAAAGFFEESLGSWWWAAVCGLLLAWVLVGLVIWNWRLRRRAKARAAREGQTEVEEWGDRLTIRSQAGETHLAYETIGKVIAGEGHVFVLYRGGQLIVPLRAFESPARMKVFADAIDARSMKSQP